MAAPPPQYDFFDDVSKETASPKVNVEVRVNEPTMAEKLQTIAHDPAYAAHALAPPFETRGQALVLGLRRLVGAIFDGILGVVTALILGFVSLFMLAFFLGTQGLPQEIAFLLALLGALMAAIFCPPLLIDVLMPLWWKTSPGKWLMGLWFENPSGEPLEFTQLLKRRALLSLFVEGPWLVLGGLFYYQLITQSLLVATLTYYGLMVVLGGVYFEVYFRGRSAPWDTPFHVQIFAKPKYPVWLFALTMVALGLATADSLNVTTAKEMAIGNAISEIQGAILKAKVPQKNQPTPKPSKALPEKKKQNAN
jgi:hypothetical protein